MEFLAYAATIIMGITLGLIGGGGSILTVPILVYLFQVNAVLATAYSLFIVGTTALAGGISYYRRGEVDLRTGFIFAIPSFLGVYAVRAFVVPQLPDPIFNIFSHDIAKSVFVMAVFAVLMLLASVSMIRSSFGKQKSPNTNAQSNNMSAGKKILLIGIEGLVVGGITGFVGAGGGFLIIPALVVLVGMPMKIAVGTSLFIIAAKSLIGFIGDVQHQAFIDWALIIKLSAIALVGLLIGTQLVKKIPEQSLKKAFGIFVLVMGAFILYDQVSKF